MTAITLPRTTAATRAAMTDQPTARETLATLVSRHQAEVWRYLRYLGAPPAEADDLTQETFLAVARAGFEKRSDGQTAGYLRAVARNQLLMLRRKQRRDPATAPLEAAEAVWAESLGDGVSSSDDAWQAMIDAAKRCVEKLADRSRQAIDLNYRDRASRDAIAERLGMKPDGVKTLLRRARTAVRECIERTVSAG